MLIFLALTLFMGGAVWAFRRAYQPGGIWFRLAPDAKAAATAGRTCVLTIVIIWILYLATFVDGLIA